MKERPILFSGEMVRAILAGTKTQTRRKMKPRPPSGVPEGVYCDPYNGNFEHFTFWTQDDKVCNGLTGNVKIKGKPTCHWKCPYGVPGDRLWVREKAKLQSVGVSERGRDWASIFYAADMSMGSGDIETHDTGPYLFTRWTPSIHMPRWASRITLEIVNVRVERLNYISVEDSLAEGITHSTLNDPRMEYAQLWNSINRPGSWEKNPWVWVVEFKRIHG